MTSIQIIIAFLSIAAAATVLVVVGLLGLIDWTEPGGKEPRSGNCGCFIILGGTGAMFFVALFVATLCLAAIPGGESVTQFEWLLVALLLIAGVVGLYSTRNSNWFLVGFGGFALSLLAAMVIVIF